MLYFFIIFFISNIKANEYDNNVLCKKNGYITDSSDYYLDYQDFLSGDKCWQKCKLNPLCIYAVSNVGGLRTCYLYSNYENFKLDDKYVTYTMKRGSKPCVEETKSNEEESSNFGEILFLMILIYLCLPSAGLVIFIFIMYLSLIHI